MPILDQMATAAEGEGCVAKHFFIFYARIHLSTNNYHNLNEIGGRMLVNENKIAFALVEFYLEGFVYLVIT